MMNNIKTYILKGQLTFITTCLLVTCYTSTSAKLIFTTHKCAIHTSKLYDDTNKKYTDKPRAEIVLDKNTITALGPGAYMRHHELEIIVHDIKMAEKFRMNYAYYDDFSEVLEFKGEVKSKNSKKPNKVKSKNVADIAAYDGSSIANSGRLKVLKLPLPVSYPAILKIQTKTQVKESVAFPAISWYYGPNVTVRSAELHINGEVEQILTHVIDPNSVIKFTQSSDGRSYSVSQLPSRKQEDFCPPALQSGPAILLAPKQGVLEGSTGDFSTWAGLGKWTSTLLKERNTLPEEAKQDVQALVKNIDDPVERIRKVYTYMQNRTHYVSIQLGIGGFKPMEPEDVHKNGYGDCKALSNYTRLLLESIGIDAYYCIIGVGDREILHPNFASVNQANHAILAVPIENDTVWLECTSQLAPANFIGENASGRYALLVKDGSGKLVKTKGATPFENYTTSMTSIELDKNGNAYYNKTTSGSGTEAKLAYQLSLSSQEERVKLIRKFYNQTVTDLEINARVTETNANPIGITRETGLIPRLAKKVGNNLLLPNFTFQTSITGPTDTINRILPIEISHSYSKSDTIRYLLPIGMKLVTELPNVNITSTHARFDITSKLIPNGIELVRTIEIHKGTYPANKVHEIASFYQKVKRADRTVLGFELFDRKRP